MVLEKTYIFGLFFYNPNKNKNEILNEKNDNFHKDKPKWKYISSTVNNKSESEISPTISYSNWTKY